jgi:hypothetical protein
MTRMLPRSLVLSLLVACAAAPAPVVIPPTCDELAVGRVPPKSVAELSVFLEATRARFYPDLQGVSIALHPLVSENDYFTSNLDLDTLSNEPRDRSYWVLDNAKLFADPPPADAIVAILVHELGHIEDYTTKSTDEMATFAIWYGTADVSAYERTTDERALAAGCAKGLKAYRIWLYSHVSDATRAKKQHDYYTPDEIDAWVAAHPSP